jgi:hypothetical protein
MALLVLPTWRSNAGTTLATQPHRRGVFPKTIPIPVLPSNDRMMTWAFVVSWIPIRFSMRESRAENSCVK